MWVLPKNYLLSSAFAQGMVASKEDLTLPGLNIESSLMLRSKPSLSQTWCRRWKQGSYLPHLFTRILKPSHRTCFEGQLTSSLEGILVNRSQHLGCVKEKMIPDTYGLSSENISQQLNLLDASLRMSKDISALDSERSLANWKRMVTAQRGEYSQRVKLAHHTEGRESLSWPTPTAHMGKEGGYPAEWTRNTPSLTVAAHKKEGLEHSSGYLNPDWVEWLMGVPTGWTDLGSWGTE